MLRWEIEHPWMMVVFVLDEKSIKPSSLVVPIIEESWFKGLEEFSWEIRVSTPLVNYENFENIASRECQFHTAILIRMMLNFNWASFHKDLFIKFSCFQNITKGIMKILMKNFCGYLFRIFFEKSLSITIIVFGIFLPIMWFWRKRSRVGRHHNLFAWS